MWGMGQTVRNEQMAGTLEQFFLTPASRVTLIIGRWARMFLTDAVIIGYTTLLLYLIGGGIVTLNDPRLFVFSLGLYELGLVGFGLFFAGLTNRQLRAVVKRRNAKRGADLAKKAVNGCRRRLDDLRLAGG
jgi:ABC-type transport system involved in multi-copper enzyme maturation permease subunit